MRAILLSLFVATPALADRAADFLDSVCGIGFAKTTMPREEAQRFCTCVKEDVAPRLSSEQRRVIGAAQDDLAQGRAPSEQSLASSGVRDLVVAGQARCEAAFYPPSAPINLSAGPMQLTLRCEDEAKKPEAFIYVKGVPLLSKAEQAAGDKRMMKDDFTPEYAKVSTSVDSGTAKNEKWEIDLTGEIVSPPNSAQLIEQLRRAATMSVVIERGTKRVTGTFQVAGKIPSRWAPCGGVSK